MPKISLFPNGCKAGVAPGRTNPTPPPRGTVSGWSQAACRRNTEFLYSVDAALLGGSGCAVTLTLRDCPPTADDWHRLRRAYLKRVERLGLIRGHWVTEWQRRGVPHLHGALYLPDLDAATQEALRRSWLDVAAEYGPSPRSQYILPITDAVGWFGYVSKHAARGVGHYQRSPEHVPPAWQGRTGRVWGKVGAWPTRDAAELELSMGAYWRWRRLERSWRRADARRSGDRRRLRSARRMLRCGDAKLSAVRGVSEWVDLDNATALVACVVAQGETVEG